MTARTLAAEFIGTLVIVLATCAAYLTAAPPVGTVAIALAAGLATLAMSCSLGHLAGGHFNPAVTVGLVAAGRMDSARLVGTIIAQLLGALAAAYLLQAILGGIPGFAPARTGSHAVFTAAANTYSEARGISLASAVVAEVAATALLVLVVIGATGRKAPAGMASLAIGAALTALYVALIPITNASLNPARSTAPAVLAGGVAMAQLWVFWVATIVGGLLGGAIAKWLYEGD